MWVYSVSVWSCRREGSASSSATVWIIRVAIPSGSLNMAGAGSHLDISLGRIRSFLAVAEHGSIRRAATALDIQNSTISRQIRIMEERVGVSLFERHGSGVRPTVAGQRLVERLRRALAGFDSAFAEARSAGTADAGELAIAFYPSLASGNLLQLIAAHRENWPRIRPEFTEAPPAEQLAGLRGREFDAAFLIGVEAMQDFDSVPLWTERVHVALPEDHILAKSDVLTWAAHPLRAICRAALAKRIDDLALAGGPDDRRRDRAEHWTTRRIACGVAGASKWPAMGSPSFPMPLQGSECPAWCTGQSTIQVRRSPCALPGCRRMTIRRCDGSSASRRTSSRVAGEPRWSPHRSVLAQYQLHCPAKAKQRRKTGSDPFWTVWRTSPATVQIPRPLRRPRIQSTPPFCNITPETCRPSSRSIDGFQGTSWKPRPSSIIAKRPDARSMRRR